jgi:hypothetical protein
MYLNKAMVVHVHLARRTKLPAAASILAMVKELNCPFKGEQDG